MDLEKRKKTKVPGINSAEPAFSIVTALGGVRAVARELECSPGAVTRWCTPKDRSKNAGNGYIPKANHEALNAMAEKLGVRGIKTKLRLM